MTDNPIEFFVQGLVLVIIIGGFYSLYSSTKAYGGLIGKAIRFLGAGMLFIVISVIERILLNFQVFEPSMTMGLIQDAFTLLGVLFLGLGFSRLAAAAKV
ncbi:MAG: hypothetical protein KW788_04465 [Candidatus Doudnabacteria bacterium]|nr:hypothetical protein [Candidatus Doudnabacteria bacterium]